MYKTQLYILIFLFVLTRERNNIFLTHQPFVTNLHLSRVELRCKLQEKLHRVSGPSENWCLHHKYICIRKKG